MTYGVTFTGKHARTCGRVRAYCTEVEADDGPGAVLELYVLGWYWVTIQTIVTRPAPACPHCGIPHRDPCPLETRRWDQR